MYQGGRKRLKINNSYIKKKKKEKKTLILDGLLNLFSKLYNCTITISERYDTATRITTYNSLLPPCHIRENQYQ